MGNHNAIWNLSGTADPTSTPTPAPIGAQYSRTTNGDLYKKTGPGDTDWTLIGGITVEQAAPPSPPPPAGTSFLGQVATLDGAFVYVGNANSDSRPIYVFRTSDNKWVTTIPAGNGPGFLAITPDGTTIYASSYYSSDVTVIDVATNTMITTIPGFTNPQALAVTPDGLTVYVANFGASTVLRIDTTTNTIVGAPIATGSLPQYILINPAGTKVYVTLAADATNGVQVISTASNTIIAAVPVAFFGPNTFDAPRGLAIKGTIIYVGSAFNNAVRRIDTTTDTITGAAIALTTNIEADLAITPSGTKVYVPQNNGSVDVIDTVTNLVATNIVAVGSGLEGLCVNPVAAFVYVSNNGGPNVKVISTSTDTVVDTVTTFITPPLTVIGTFQTFILNGTHLTDEGGGVLDIGLPVVFDDSTVGVYQNIRSARDDQSVIDNSKVGVTNFGSQTGAFKPGALGALGDYSTIGGGDDNQVGPTGFETIGGGAGNLANGDSSVIGGGFENTVQEDFSTIGGGSGNSVSGGGGYDFIGGGFGNSITDAEGYAAIVGGQSNSIGSNHGFIGNGTNNLIPLGGGAFSSILNGSNNQAQSGGSVIGGTNNSGFGGVVLGGVDNQANNSGVTLGGQDNQSLGLYTVTQGRGSTAGVDSAIALGWGSDATHTATVSHSSGYDSLAPGDRSQQTTLTMCNQTPGAAPGESVALNYGSLENLDLNFPDGSFAVVITGVARGNIAGIEYTRAFRQMVALSATAGVLTLVASGSQEAIGDVPAASWTLTASSDGTNLILTFTTGATTAACIVTAKLDMAEIYGSP